MSTPNTEAIKSVINLEGLLTPIEENNPSGENLQYSGLYDEIREARRSEDGEEQGEWKHEVKTADWNKVITLSTNALETKTKDLQIAVWLSEALVNNYGFLGLYNSLELLTGLLEKFWATIYPQDEDGDLEGRANAFSWFDRQISLAIRQEPITASTLTDNYSYLQYEESKNFDIPEKIDDLSSDEIHHIEELKETATKEHKITSEQWRKAKNTSSVVFYQTANQLLSQCWQAYLALDKVMDEKFTSQTPGLRTLKNTLDDIRSLIEKVCKEKQPPAPVNNTSNAPMSSSSDLEINSDKGEKSSTYEQPSTNFVASSGIIKSRNDALQRLKEVAEYFHKTEPHSPVSFLVERAVKWGEMPLDEWLAEVIKNNDVLGQVQETLGIKS